jgi:hypothetical protein
MVVVGDPKVDLDANAIDGQGGIVSVRLRRDDEPWSDPLPYHDSYRWSIDGALGLHTFAVEYRDRADNVTVVTAMVRLSRSPVGTVRLLETTDRTVTLGFSELDGAATEAQIAATPDFAGAVWRPIKDTLTWSRLGRKPRVLYIRFRARSGLVGEEVRRLYLPNPASARPVTPPAVPDRGR